MRAGPMPAGFCTWAWHDIYPAVTSLRFGGNFPWMKKEGMVISCCSDGARPVFFRIERTGLKQKIQGKRQRAKAKIKRPYPFSPLPPFFP